MFEEDNDTIAQSIAKVEDQPSSDNCDLTSEDKHRSNSGNGLKYLFAKDSYRCR